MALKSCFYLIVSLVILAFFSPVQATPIKFFNSKYFKLDDTTKQKIEPIISNHFNLSDYRQIAVQVLTNEKRKPSHLLVYLFSKKYHQVDIIKINIDAHFNFIAMNKSYGFNEEDNMQQPGISTKQAQCPDPSIEFITFAPNDDDLEQEVTLDVLKAAHSHGIKTINLIKEEATRTNYLNYMKCPKLKGNFYDGDANPEVITTVDGVISFHDIDEELQQQFGFKVTNIWLACEAYNDPIKTSMLTIAQSQKYAAGINNLLVGPSDWAANCSIKAAMNGKPMTASFWDCYAKYDVPSDQWGYGGNGSDFFGV